MMTLRLMTTIIGTVHDGESKIANEIAAPWEHDSGSVRFFRASANFLFTLKISGQSYVLRFNHAAERTPGFIQAEMEFLTFLANEGIRVPRPIRSKAGNYVESIVTAYGTFYAVVFAVLEGDQVDFEELAPDGFVTWGKSLGMLHNAAQQYQGTGRPTWQDQLTGVAASLPADETAARTTLTKLTSVLSALPIRLDNYGLIHFDFELDNVIWDEASLGIVDFDDCAWYWFVADVAFALRDLADDSADHLDLNDARMGAFVDGYRAVRELPPQDLTLIPLFLRVHHLITFTKLLRTLDLDAQPDELAWVTALRQKLIRKVQHYRDEFAAYTRT